MKRLAPLLLLVTSIATAALVVTEQPSSYELRDDQSRVISRGYATKEACFAAATGPGRYRCVNIVIADIVGACDPAPIPPPVAIGGFIRGDYEEHACPNEHLSFTQIQPQRDPWPSCAWVDRPVPVTDCDGRQLNPPYDDGGTSTAQTDSEPGPWIEGVDYEMGAACPAGANGNCSPSPNTPKEPPAGCVSEFCVTVPTVPVPG